MAFDFSNYGISPLALVDSEMLIQELLRAPESGYDKAMDEESGNWLFTCKHCGSKLKEHYDEYSISMCRSYVEWQHGSKHRGNYLVGFYGFDLKNVSRIGDYRKVANALDYISSIKYAQQGNAPDAFSAGDL